VTADTTCLAPGAVVTGTISVAAGASLVATDARITGNVTATDASVVELIGTTVGGNVRVASATGRVIVFASTINGTLTANVNKPAAPAVLVGNKTGK
jgi:nitrous oxidase accessory protein NosD